METKMYYPNCDLTLGEYVASTNTWWMCS